MKSTQQTSPAPASPVPASTSAILQPTSQQTSPPQPSLSPPPMTTSATSNPIINTSRSRLVDSTRAIIEEGEEFSCPICFELYTEKGKKVPRMLECGHTFCHECLQESLLAFGGRLICGKCGSATDDTTARRGCHALKINQTVLDKIVSKRTKNAKAEEALTKQCDECAQALASIYCYACNANFCSKCCSISHTTRLQNKHKRVPIQQTPRGPRMCKDHITYPLNVFCKTEQRAICALCAVICAGKGHPLQSPDEATGNLREDLLIAISQAEEAVRVGEASLVDLTKLSQEAEGAMLIGTSTVSTEMEKLRTLLTERENQLIQEMNKKTSIDELRDYIKDTEKQITSLSAVVAEISTYLTTASDTELLSEYKSQVEKIQVVRSDIKPRPAVSQQSPFFIVENLPQISSCAKVVVS